MLNKLPFVTVYNITYNQCDILRNVISRLFQQDYPPEYWQLVVFNDGSDDGTLELLNQQSTVSPVPMLILSEAHQSDYMSARRWNQCISHGIENSDVFIQLDDVLTHPDFIRQHVKWHMQAVDYLVTGSKFEGDHETWRLEACRRASLATKDGGANEISFYKAVWGASLSFRKTLMERVFHPPFECPYDERMVGWGYHEIELALRMHNVGGRIIYDPAAGVYHQDHTPESERKRGFNREKLIEAGSSFNLEYIRRKHQITDLERW